MNLIGPLDNIDYNTLIRTDSPAQGTVSKSKIHGASESVAPRSMLWSFSLYDKSHISFFELSLSPRCLRLI